MVPRPLRLLLGLACAIAPASGAALTGGAAAAAPPRTVIYNLTDRPLQHPPTFYLAADAGPRLEHLRWRHWGAATATATGAYVVDCSGCDAVRRPVTVTLRRPTSCPAAHGRIYRFGRFTTRDAGGRRHTSPLPTGAALCTPTTDPGPS